MPKERREKETTAAASMGQNQESTTTPSSAFKHKQTKSRSLKKADKALPNSTHKRNDIHVQLQEPTIKGRKPASPKEEEGQWIVSIYLTLNETL